MLCATWLLAFKIWCIVVFAGNDAAKLKSITVIPQLSGLLGTEMNGPDNLNEYYE